MPTNLSVLELPVINGVHMRKYLALSLCILFVLLLTISCTNKKEIKLQIEDTKKQIRIIDDQISQLETKIAVMKAATGTNPLGENVAHAKLDPEINRLKSEREILMVKLKALYEKL